MNILTKKIIAILAQETNNFMPTLITKITSQYGKNPYLILICCLLSLRSKDIITINVCESLLSIGKTPKEILAISLDELEKIIFKIGFYKSKAKVLHQVSKILLEKYNSHVPQTEVELLSLPGVGRKTANLVLGLAFDIPAICVDVHVHRISNRLGLIKTKNTLEAELALQKILPKKYWIIWNDLIVKHGQNICTPQSPKCSICKIKEHCKQIGVTKTR